ncbi:zona pellucida sperm-binding protein 3-like [Colossoma macropomum]|uniref:zona pellucida sperm-binding protein 3-like n=1 Tax=Colossoma macropomum TaxID=42526 RepID=UPI001864CC54|nr:zona pellucida sperm-binding protein 3-like [Colossoma macropomum]
MGLKQMKIDLLLVLVVGLCKVQFSEWKELTQDEKPAVAQSVPQPVQKTATDFLLGDNWRPIQAPVKVQSEKVMQSPVKNQTSYFPQAPEKPEQPKMDVELPQPVRANSVGADCGENAVRVVVRKDLFGIGAPINPLSLSLGGCPATGEDSAAQILIFESELQACSSMLMMTEDELVYTFTLLYAPEPFAGTPVVRTVGAAVIIECHYIRKHNVSSNSVTPTWKPINSAMASEDVLVFSLRLMTDDWQFERRSNQYFLSDLMNIEASVMQFNHVPLWVFMDSCVATAEPNVNAITRYVFIENHGCLIDAKITGSKSRFMPRIQRNKLQLQLEAFRFQVQSGDEVYITCLLKAVIGPSPTDVEHKACSFSSNRWTSADANQAAYDQVCSCCDTSCSFRKGKKISRDAAQWWEKNISLGPILVKE